MARLNIDPLVRAATVADRAIFVRSDPATVKAAEEAHADIAQAVKAAKEARADIAQAARSAYTLVREARSAWKRSSGRYRPAYN